MQIIKAGVMYFIIVFGTGFVLGIVRILWLERSFGIRMAELIEMPIMFVVIIVTARLIIRRFSVPNKLSIRCGIGCFALALLITAEFLLVIWIRDLSIKDYLANKDPVSGTVYYLMLVVFAIVPLLVSRR
jgi:type IV secretory pathway TrbD component